MAYHYKAFISYRHDPADSRIASEIQTQVERYRIPYSIRKEKGIKSVGTVFRDKEELSAGSDLNENIQWALLNSEFLIVICSKRLKDSAWCRKEIEFFLEHRDHRHVVTVLVDGEPFDVIPKILLEQTIATQDANGNPVEVKVPLEPLSCDYRMPVRRARREELPRLIAVLTGIRYGELMQRQKKRRRRLLTAAAAAAAVLIAYLSWSLVNIRAGYRRTQISESVSMAENAMKMIDNNNHLAALRESLQAVPTPEDPRPFVPAAQYALSRSLHSYEAPSYINNSDVERFEFDSRITNGLSNDDGSLMMVFEMAHSRLSFYDVKNHSEIGQLPCKQLTGSVYLGQNRALVYNQTELTAVGMEDGSILWTQYFDDWVFSCSYAPEDQVLLVTTSSGLIVMSPDGREIAARFPLTAYTGDKEARLGSGYMSCSSPNGRKHYCLIDNSTSYIGSSFIGVLIYDSEKGTASFSPLKMDLSLFCSVCADDRGNIYLSGFESDGDEASAISLDYSASPYYTVCHGRYTSAAFRTSDGKLLWKNSYPYQSAAQNEGVSKLYLTRSKDSAGLSSEVLLSFISSRMDMLDPKTGKLLLSYDLGSELASPIEGDEAAFLTQAGHEVSLLSSDEDMISVMESFPADMVSAKRIAKDVSYSGKSQTFLFGRDVVLLFEREQGDSSWRPFISADSDNASPDAGQAGAPEFNADIYAKCVGNRYAAFASEDGSIQIYDLEAKALRHSLTGLDYFPDLYGFSKDESALYYAADVSFDSPVSDKLSVCCCTIETGETKVLPVCPGDLAGELTDMHSINYPEKSGLMISEVQFRTDSGEKWFFMRTDMESGKAVLIPSALSDYSLESYCSEDGAHGLAVPGGLGEGKDANTGCLIDFESAEAVTCSDIPGQIQEVIWNGSDGSCIVLSAADRYMQRFGRDGRMKADTWYDGTFLVSGAVRDGRLYALHQDAVLSVYDADTLNLIESFQLEETTILSGAQVSWQFTADGSLLLTADSVLYEINVKESGLVGKVPFCLGYSEENNVFVIPDYFGDRLGYCPRLTLSDLIRKGRSILNGEADPD